MTARIIVTIIFLGLCATLGQVNGCSGSRPYGYLGIDARNYIIGAH